MTTRFRAAAAAVVLALAPALAAPGHAEDAKLRLVLAGPQRAEANRVRDPYRHPLQGLEFFGLRDDMTVVEIWPGGSGWWTEILAPYLLDHGRYYAALPETTRSAESRTGNAAFARKIAANPALYSKVVVTTFAGDRHPIAPAGSADLVLSFRNLHNWLTEGTAEGAFRAFYRALKPGGVLGLVDHRADPARPREASMKAGYVRADEAVALAERAGFRLVARSDINANPRDTKDYPEGVWSLPPTYREKDKDRAKYRAIGESDRFTLKFVKPKVGRRASAIPRPRRPLRRAWARAGASPIRATRPRRTARPE
jgi:predicted methyltransferase